MAKDIAQYIEDCRRRLLDLTKRNRLLNCKLGPKAALKFCHPSVSTVWQSLVLDEATREFVWKQDLVPDAQSSKSESASRELLLDDSSQGQQEQRIPLKLCLESPKLTETHLLTEYTDRNISTRLNRLSLLAKESLSEQGVNILYLGFGLLRWYETPQSELEILSPLLLVPVSLDRTGTTAPWKLSLYEQEVIPNYSLREKMQGDFRIRLPDPESEKLLEAPERRQEYLEQVQAAIAEQPRWEILDETYLGVFNFQKLAMWQDYQANEEILKNHPHITRIAGGSNSTVDDFPTLPAPKEFDAQIHPREIHSILPCDASQYEAILAVKRGGSLIIDGPPGTGKSQTIANIIAQCIADKKTVLFVSEKAAALEVVKRRLDQNRLGDFVLACHSHKSNKLEIIKELGRCLHLPSEPKLDQEEKLNRLYDMRNRLNSYVAAMHRSYSALKKSPFEILGELAALLHAPKSRCDLPSILQVDHDTLNRIKAQLNALADCQEVIENYRDHPWKGCLIQSLSLTQEEDLQFDFGQLINTLDMIELHARPLIATEALRPLTNVSALEQGLAQVASVLLQTTIPESWYDGSLTERIKQLLQLQSLIERHRLRIGQLPEFNPEILRNSDLIALAADATFPPSQLAYWTKVFRGQPPKTLFSTISAVEQFQQESTKLSFILGQLEQHVIEICDALGLPRSLLKSKIKDLNKLLKICDTLLKSSQFKAEWFQPEKRRALSDALPSLIAEQKQLAGFRAEIADRLRADMLPAIDDAFIEAVLSYDTIWSRFSSDWRHIRTQISGLYKVPKKQSTKVVHSDFAKLKELKALEKSVDNHLDVFRSQLITDREGHYDWDSTAQGMQVAEELAGIIAVPPAMVDQLVRMKAREKSALQNSTSQFRVKYRAFYDEAKKYLAAYSLTSVLNELPALDQIALSNAQTALAEAENRILQLSVPLRRLSDYLQPGCDLDFRNLDAKFRQLADASESHKELSDVARQIPDVPEDCWLPERLDPTVLGQAIVGLSQLQRAYGEKLPGWLISLLSNSVKRSEYLAQASKLESILKERHAHEWQTLQKYFPLDVSVSTGIVLGNATIHELRTWLQQQVQTTGRIAKWIKYRQTESALRTLGAEKILKEILDGGFLVNDATEAFLRRFYSKWIDEVFALDPQLQNFRAQDHQELVKEFGILDREVIQNAPERIRSVLQIDDDRAWMSAMTVDESILDHEYNKKKRHLPIRQLFRKIPRILQKLKPCLMMSPLAVSTFLESQDIKFDVVIFDEASQVLPWDALGAIYRGKQLVVAGDQKQLPPTTFFEQATNDDESEETDEEDYIDDVADYESILDVLCTVGMPRRRIRWHYRSRREALIAFSNKYFYDRELITFPSVADLDSKSAVRFEYVENGRWRSKAGFNPNEARRVAELIAQHYLQNPEKSLGVITFNKKQQLLVHDELSRLRQQDPRLEKAMTGTIREPLFIKNLENVQGDERDCIILSVAYGPDEATNRLAMRFGPINNKGGERRLNVAVTRARDHIIVVSSILPDQIDESRAPSFGTKLLKAYLEYAKNGPEALEKQAFAGDATESPFEAEVANTLMAQGLEVRAQIGCGKYRLDLGILHPEFPGRYLLGIECDGATYHSSATARDRDRLRQEVLEGLGWRIERIWSTDWVRNPQDQIQRILRAYEEQLEKYTQENAKQFHNTPEVIRIQDFTEETSASRYANIDEVPDAEMQQAIFDVLDSREGEDVENDELVRLVTYKLGFKRIGSRISAVLNRMIKRMNTRNLLKKQGKAISRAC